MSDVRHAEVLETITKISRVIKTAFNQQVVVHGLTYARALVLFHLARKPNQTQTSLAHDLELERATLVHLLDRMEENGLIERRLDPSDRRVRLIAITPEGEKQATLVGLIADHVGKRALDHIDPRTLTAALELLDSIAANISSLEPFNAAAS